MMMIEREFIEAATCHRRILSPSPITILIMVMSIVDFVAGGCSLVVVVVMLSRYGYGEDARHRHVSAAAI